MQAETLVNNWRAIQPSSAIFSDDRVYRYALSREVGSLPRDNVLTFIMLNPSTADETKNDPTVSRCISYARRLCYGTLLVANIFAYRATQPAKLRETDDPVGPENDAAILSAASCASRIICAWGVNGKYMGRQQEVLRLLNGLELHVLGLTKRGHPKHPLYVRKEVTPMLWKNAI